MKYLSLIILFLLLITEQNFSQFVHPGMLQNKQDLNFLRSSVRAGNEPGAAAWKQLQASPTANLNWQPKPIKVIVVGFYSKPDIGADLQK